MIPPLSQQDLADAQEFLTTLFTEVQEQESPLAGGTKLGMGSTALQGLRETRIAFGHPTNNLIKLTPALFQATGIELSAIWQQQMQTRFDFYYLTLSVSLQPGKGTQFRRVECWLNFASSGGNDVIIQRMFPTSAWKEILSLGGEVSLTLDGALDWGVSVDLPAAFNLAQLPVAVQTHLANKDTLKAFVTIPRYTLKLGRTEIAATGEGNSACFWRIERAELRETQSVEFALVFKVPQGTKTVSLTGLVAIEPDMKWLVNSIRNVFAYLSAPLQAILRRHESERNGKERLPLGDHETWTLTLPE